MSSPDAATLSGVPLLAELTDEERETLASWLEVEEFEAGQRPIRERKAGYAFYILVQGEARAELEGKVLEKLGPGAVFGEMAFFSPDGRRSADIVTETPVVVYSMFGTRFREMQTSLPDVADRLQKVVEERAARIALAGGE